jgi:hypothetical protein
MAEIDSRIIELVETLAAAGADWLAFEIIDGIRFGRPLEGPEHRQRNMPRDVDAWEGESLSAREREFRETAMEPIRGDEQIKFAAAYVVERLNEVIEMTRLSLDNLDKLSAEPLVDLIETQQQPRVPLTLGIEDSDFHLTQVQAKRMLLLMPSLHTSLSDWATDALRRGSHS